MTSDITTTADAAGVTAPLVRVVRDRETGQTLIALDADAVHGLLTVLEGTDFKTMRRDPDSLSMDAEDARLAADVGGDILAQLHTVAPHLR